MGRASLDLPIMRSAGAEKEFYLRSFRHRGIVVSFHGADAVDRCGPVVEELVDNAAMVLLVSPAFRKGRSCHPLGFADLAASDGTLLGVGCELLEHGCAAVRRPRALSRARVIAFNRALCERLQVDKLVLCDRRGGLLTAEGRRSFVTVRGLQQLLARDGKVGAWSRTELRELASVAASGGVAVNLTTAAGLAQELFTYEGSGTLVTRDRYCRVRALGLGDFSEALALLRRGEREGFLLERSDDERTRLLLTGYGAWFENARLAGVASLVSGCYRRNRVGEIRGLYTITRFKGEGVGPKILAHLIAQARVRGLRALFACTSNARAAAFFERGGFCKVARSKVPSAKWNEGKRVRAPQVFWYDL